MVANLSFNIKVNLVSNDLYNLNLSHIRYIVKYLNPNDLIIPRNEEQT